jgi:hypothetical protein
MFNVFLPSVEYVPSLMYWTFLLYSSPSIVYIQVHVQISLRSLVATSADSVPSSYLVRITIAPIGTTFGILQRRRYQNNFTFEYSSNNNIFSFVAMSADSVPSSKTNIFQSKLIYCRHFRTYWRCAMFDWSDTVFRRRNVTRRRISNTVLQPRYWGREADSPEVCRLSLR